MMHNRNDAVEAAATQQQIENDRTIAVVNPQAPAVVPRAERPEPTPYEKFGGCAICEEVHP